MAQGFLIAPRTAADEQDYTYRRVLENGEWVMRRVPVTGPLPNGSPVFPKRAPEFKMGENPGSGSSVVDHLLKRDRVYIRSKDMGPHTLAATLIPRVLKFQDQGFDWVIEALPNNGPANISFLNERLGQQFTLYFTRQEYLSMWAANNDVKPHRIVRKNFPYAEDGDVLTAPEGNEGVELLVFGRSGKQETTGFGRMVDLD